MELDDKVEVTAGPQDFIVQRGTVHAWHNRTDEWCRESSASIVFVPRREEAHPPSSTPTGILFVVLPAKEILVDGKVRDQPKQH